MTTESSTFTDDPQAQPAQTSPLTLIEETPEERARAGRAQRQAYKNLEYLDEIFDDLLREHRGRLVVVYGDRQVLIGDDGYEMHESLTEEEQETATLLPITTWWIRHAGEPE